MTIGGKTIELPPKGEDRVKSVKPKVDKRRGKGLEPRELRFINEYLIEQNGTQAAIRAGYAESGAATAAYDLLRKPEILLLVNEGLEKLLDAPLTDAERVIKEAASVAFSDLRRLFKADGTMLDIKDIPDDLAPAIASIEILERRGRDGQPEVFKRVRLWDKTKGLELLARYHKLLTDKIETRVTGVIAGLPDLKGLSDGQLAELLAKYDEKPVAGIRLLEELSEEPPAEAEERY